MYTVRVPSLAENVNEATLLLWLVKEGDTVAEGDDLAELLTEKAEFTLTAEAGGTVSTILVPPKSVMPVGAALCLLDGTDEDATTARRENEDQMIRHLSAATVQMPAMDTLKDSDPPAGLSTVSIGSKTPATPSARRIAKENDLDLADVAKALGITGIIKDDDVRTYLDSHNK